MVTLRPEGRGLEVEDGGSGGGGTWFSGPPGLLVGIGGGAR